MKHCCPKEDHHKLQEPVIRCRNLSFSYPGSPKLLSEINIEISHPSNVCIVGPNGCGKTTFLKLILGLIQPSSGSIEVFGSPAHKACSLIGYVPQFINVRADFPVTVREVILMGCIEKHIFGWHHKHCRDDAEEVMRKMGICDLADKQFSSLSGGQKQRTLIARALISNPKLLLLDEPTASVDPATVSQFRQIIDELSGRISICTVSHDLDFITKAVDQVLLVNRTVTSVEPDAMNGDNIFQLYHKSPQP